MQAAEKREQEQQKFLEKLHETAVTDDHGEYESGISVLKAVHLLIEIIIEERNGHVEATNSRIILILTSVLDDINDFARVPEEAAVLKYRLLELLLKDCFREAQSELLKIQVHEPKRLYAGHQATDEV